VRVRAPAPALLACSIDTGAAEAADAEDGPWGRLANTLASIMHASVVLIF